MIKIITDSTADFTKEQAEQLNITVVPLNVMFGEKVYFDGVDLQTDEFYRMLEKCEKLPTTSQPTPEAFLEHFEIAKENKDTVICIVISAELSGTYQSAEIAKSICGYEDIYIVNSLNATLGLQLLVRKAVELAKQGKSGKAIVEELETAKENVCVYAVVNDLKYLRKGGRLSSTAAIAGGLIGIKPLIEISNGKVSVAGKARGLQNAYASILKLIEKSNGIDETNNVVVGYTGDKSCVEAFLLEVSKNLNTHEPFISAIGSVIGTHAGPGACGIAYIRN